MTVKISQEFKHFESLQSIEMKRVMNAIQTDSAMLKAAFDALVAKVNIDFTAQNIAVGSSQLDEDYAASTALTFTK